MSDISIVEYRPGGPLADPRLQEYLKDIARLELEFCADIGVPEEGLVPFHERLKDYVAVFIARDTQRPPDKQVIGYAALLSPSEENTVELNELYVRPLHRRQGIGKELYRQSIDFARREHAGAVTLMIDRHHSRFSWLTRIEGFVPEVEIDDVVFMRKTIS